VKPPPKLHDSQGRPLLLGRLIGKGGEGSVYELTSDDLVVKLYHQPLTQERTEKIQAMVRLKTEALLRVAAWPVDTVHHRPGSETVGLLMPKVSGYQEIHNLYSPKSRLAEFPSATWKFLMHAATNLARAFAVIHEHGHLVGDVNHGNALVSRQATVRLIDCDSFQVQANGRQFLCEVGVLTHVPPELQSGSLRVLRTENHDAFGLAVMIFQILFMGRHPFSGRYLGAGDMPIEKAIREHRFAYGPFAASRQMNQPPNTLDLGAASPAVGNFFERAFSPEAAHGGGRPRAREWVAALEAIRTVACPRNPAHLYLNSLAACPWCDLEIRVGIVFFYNLSVQSQGADFDIAAVWAEISAVPPPGPPPAVPSPGVLQLSPSPSMQAATQGKRPRQLLAILVFGAGLAFCFVASSGGALILLGALVLAAGILRWGTSPIRVEAKQRLQASQAALRRLEGLWPQQTGNAPFRTRLAELEKLREEYRALPAHRMRQLADLEANRRNAQLDKFLDRYRIDQTQISGIGPGRTATLQSFGIETARDVNWHDVLQVPGFGNVLARTLTAWRRSIENRFVFDPRKGVDPNDAAAVERRIATRRTEIERTLRSGAVDLKKIGQQIMVHRQFFLQQLEIASQDVAQAQADLRALWL
jgi:DNA-binding helix-hairpin-helix protein with protein kinase domain